MLRGNLFAECAMQGSGECINELLQAPGLRLERIVSVAHATPHGQWYDQPRPEWVLVLKGAAGLRIEGVADVMTLNPGDYVLLPEHLRHRVEWTDPSCATIWLALHYSP